MTTALLQPGSTAPDLTVTASDGERFALSTLWQEQPLLLAFLRHYG